MPIIEKVADPIIVHDPSDVRLGCDIEALLCGHAAALVIPAAGVEGDFEGRVLDPTMSHTHTSLMDGRPVIFDRAAQVRGNNREKFHIGAFDPGDPNEAVYYPVALTVCVIKKGAASLMVASASEQMRLVTQPGYLRLRDQLNGEEAVRSEYDAVREAGYRRVFHTGHTGVSGAVGVVYLGQGDVAIFPQGGGVSKVPSWHTLITPPNVHRVSESYHLVNS